MCEYSKKLKDILDKYDDRFNLSELLEQYLSDIVAVRNENLDFVNASVILENSTKVYGKNVDQCVAKAKDIQEILLNNDLGDDPNTDNGGAATKTRRRRANKAYYDPDDFYEIENKSKKRIDYVGDKKKKRIEFLDPICNLFVKLPKMRDNKYLFFEEPDDKDNSRLRDWFINEEMMIVREPFSIDGIVEHCSLDELASDWGDDFPDDDFNSLGPSTPHSSSCILDEGLDNGYTSCSEESFRMGHECESNFESEHEFPEVREKNAAEPNGEIIPKPVDIADAEKLADIPNKTMRPANTSRKLKEVKTKPDTTMNSLVSYFFPHQNSSVDSPYGSIPDAELVSVYKEKLKAVGFLKIQGARPYNPTSADKDDGFCGFEDDIPRSADDSMHHAELSMDRLELPELLEDLASSIPVVDHPDPVQSVKPIKDGREEFKERNRQLAENLSKWRKYLDEKLVIVQSRRALDMDVLADEIMGKLKDPVSDFKNLVEDQSRRDISRYFITCLQLTNEGNVDITKANQDPLGTDSMVIKKLQAVRLKELNDYNPEEHVVNEHQSNPVKPPKKVVQRKRKNDAG